MSSCRSFSQSASSTFFSVRRTGFSVPHDSADSRCSCQILEVSSTGVVCQQPPGSSLHVRRHQPRHTIPKSPRTSRRDPGQFHPPTFCRINTFRRAPLQKVRLPRLSAHRHASFLPSFLPAAGPPRARTARTLRLTWRQYTAGHLRASCHGGPTVFCWRIA
jgi:hypothetical protein